MKVRVVVDRDLSWQNENPVVHICSTKEKANRVFEHCAEIELKNYWWEDTDKILSSKRFDSEDDYITYKQNEFLQIIDWCDMYIEEVEIDKFLNDNDL